MAKPSKRNPWVVEVNIAGRWYECGAYPDKEIAEAHRKLAEKRDAQKQEWRVRCFTEAQAA